MSRKFSRIFKWAKRSENRVPFNADRDRLVLFSDHHKGDKSSADDFKKNASLYDMALSYYKKEGYRLIALGDNEELWENSYDQILQNYSSILKKEIEIAIESLKGKKIRLWGNHDKEVSLRRFKKFCQMLDLKILDNVEYREALCLGDDIFLIHGHQGRFFEDRAWKISRWAVHFIWKTIQNIFHIGIDGPSENYKIRDNLEMSYYQWAKKNRVLLICGHTHRAIFGSMTQYDRLLEDIHRIKKEWDDASLEKKPIIQKALETRIAHVDKILKARRGKAPKAFEIPHGAPVPCYFNDGCCGYTNGITCIEIDKGLIRLIKWQRQENKRITLNESDLRSLLEVIKKGKTDAS